MRRVVSLFLPHLAIERLRRLERVAPRLPERSALQLPVDDDPGACSVPQGGGWRPGARWARTETTRADVEQQIAALPTHAQPPMRELGRRSEGAAHPFRATAGPSQARRAEGGVPSSQHIPVLQLPPVLQAPLALIDKVGRREEIVAVCPAAAALGIYVGMAATHARALVSDLDFRPAEPRADAALLDRLTLLAVRRWTPIAATAPPDGIWLDLTGCDHLHGGEERFCRHLHAFCERAGFTARVALADTPGAAHAVARSGADDIVVVPIGNTIDALSSLPIAALRLSDGALGAARRFGFERIADLLPVARGPLARRLGLPAITRLDQAIGAVAEPISSREDPSVPMVERRLLEPIVTAEAIAQVMADLLDDLAELLRARGLGVRALRLTGLRVDGGEQIVAIGTSRPTREVPHLLRLLKLRIERIDPGMGLEQFVLVAPHTEPLDAVDLGAVLAGETRSRDPARLVDVVAGRIGTRAVFRIAPVPSHVPERAVTVAEPVEAPGRWPLWQRPVRLLARPEPLHGIIALLPDQPPRRFEWRGRSYKVVAGDGPERIHGEWWRRDAEVWAVRDYYRVEDGEGGRWWVFRRGDGFEAATGDLSWWMHGMFA
ncbi:DNA polymerase Y family protein [uncultured Sphingomonas sp.]|uniref:Y-family DNA polymerase n=1 Tax=uncultured Sphingomonas sp. TaxID=158754 RepID=UPI0035CA3AD4